MNIKLMTLSEVTKVSGEAGNFTVELTQHPRYVDMEKCIACGACSEKCPKRVSDDYNEGLGKRKAIYVEYSQAVPLKYCIDDANCIYMNKGGKCGLCKKICPTDAVDYDQKPEALTLEVGAVIAAPGFSAFDPSDFDTYQYANYANVITSMELERVLSATGPFGGHLIRPSDKREPAKIAWLQCVGSRDQNRCDNGYCSSVCCMYAVKEAVIAKEHATGDLDTAIFYMDMRTYGKDFERYYDRARDEVGVRFVRSRVHTIVEDTESKDLLMKYVDDFGQMQEERFDLVVLSVGMQTSKNVVELSERLEIELDSDRFVKTGSFSPVETSRPGIFVCGAVQEPKDIPASVMEASAAACQAEISLSASRGALTKSKTYPEEKALAEEEPRIGVFACHCGTNIAGTVDVPAIAEEAKSLPGVVHVEETLFACSQDAQDKMKEIIEREGLNRIVVSACTPRTHEELFQETLRDAGLNKYLFEMANVRNQCSWVHSGDKEAATDKARDLLRMAVARAGLIGPLKQASLPVDSGALVIGGGITGMTAALGLADQGFKVSLVEKETELGGNALALDSTWREEPIADEVAEMTGRVNAHEGIDVYTGAEVEKSDGFVGNFQTVLAGEKGNTTLNHGAVIVATGAEELRPAEYLYGEDDRILTHLEMDKALKAGDEKVTKSESAVFIQCVGSREPERPWCSKVCCTHAVKSALKLKKMDAGRDVYVLYRDIRTYGQRERIYRDARDAGVIFIRYDLDAKPVVKKAGDVLTVTIKDHVLQMDMEIQTDLISLAAAIVPRENEALAQMFKLSTNADNFFAEAHAKLRPVEFATAGIFLAGLAHYPKPVEESIAQAKAAASRAAVALSKEMITVDGIVSNVDASMCRWCGECEKACPFNAVNVEETEGGARIAVVQEALCKGCGACAAACPTGAVSVYNYDDEEVLTMVDAAMDF